MSNRAPGVWALLTFPTILVVDCTVTHKYKNSIFVLMIHCTVYTKNPVVLLVLLWLAGFKSRIKVFKIALQVMNVIFIKNLCKAFFVILFQALNSTRYGFLPSCIFLLLWQLNGYQYIEILAAMWLLKCVRKENLNAVNHSFAELYQAKALSKLRNTKLH